MRVNGTISNARRVTPYIRPYSSQPLHDAKVRTVVHELIGDNISIIDISVQCIIRPRGFELCYWEN